MSIRLVYLTLLLAAPLAAQELACTADAGVPPMVRAEGAAEYVSDIQIICTGGTPTPAGNPVPQYTLQVSLNTNITSRLTSNPFSEALLLVDDPAPNTQRYCTQASGCLVTAGAFNAPNVFQARQTSPNTLTLAGIPIDPPGPNLYRQFRIVNVRANATSLAATPDAPIRALVTLSGPTAIPIAANQMTVAFVRTGLIAGVRHTVAGYPQCNAVNTAATPTTFLRFTEGFPTAFRRRNAAVPASFDSSPTPNAQNIPGAIFYTETNFYNPAPNIVSGADTGVASAGLADHGTRLVARFTNIPAGVSLTASLYSLNPTANAAARLVTANADGSGPFTPAASGNIAIANGSGTAVWEVLAGDIFTAQTFEFSIGVSYAPGVANGAISVATAIAPAATGTPRTLLSILPCNVSALTPAADTVPAAGATGKTIAVTAPGSWSASADVPWLTLTSASAGSGNGTLTYDVAANTTASTRTGVISVSGWTVTITQSSATSGSFSLNNGNAFVGPNAGSGSLNLSGPAGAPWQITGGAPFLAILPSSGVGPAVISYFYTANPTAVTRSAVTLIGDAMFNFSQSGIPAVPVTLSPTSDSVPMAGAIARTINVTANPLAAWTAVGDPPRVTILSGASGSGNGTVTYSVTPSPNTNSRQYALTISDQTFLINQSGPTAVNTGPIAGSGAVNTFTFRFNHPTSAGNFDVVNALINTALNGNSACYIAYSRPNQVLYLVNDGGPGSGLSAGLALGGSGSVSNNQCTIYSEGSSATESGLELTLNVNIQFKPAFAGAKVVYLAARDTGGANSGWFTQGVWNVPGAAVTYPRPASLTSINPTTTLVFEDQTNANNLQTVWALVSTAVDGRAACYVAYHVPSNRLYLVPDNGDGAQATSRAWTYPDPTPLENSQCRVHPAATEVIKSGNRLYLSLYISPKIGFTGPRAIWTAVQNIAGQVSPWTAAGSILSTF